MKIFDKVIMAKLVLMIIRRGGFETGPGVPHVIIWVQNTPLPDQCHFSGGGKWSGLNGI